MEAETIGRSTAPQEALSLVVTPEIKMYIFTTSVYLELVLYTSCKMYNPCNHAAPILIFCFLYAAAVISISSAYFINPTIKCYNYCSTQILKKLREKESSIFTHILTTSNAFNAFLKI